MSKNEKTKEEKNEDTKKIEEGTTKQGKDEKVICRECGKEGHFSYNCPQIKCYNCGEYGHKSYDCPNKSRGYQRGGRGSYRRGYGYGYGGGYGGYDRYYRESKCYNCGKYGHKSFECDKPNGKNCYICGKPGHISKDCPDKKQEE